MVRAGEHDGSCHMQHFSVNAPLGNLYSPTCFLKLLSVLYIQTVRLTLSINHRFYIRTDVKRLLNINVYFNFRVFIYFLLLFKVLLSAVQYVEDTNEIFRETWIWPETVNDTNRSCAWPEEHKRLAASKSCCLAVPARPKFLSCS